MYATKPKQIHLCLTYTFDKGGEGEIKIKCFCPLVTHIKEKNICSGLATNPTHKHTLSIADVFGVVVGVVLVLLLLLLIEFFV